LLALNLTQGPEPRAVAGRTVPDDAVVVRIAGGQLMIQTLDFFTPICDDPYLFGQIAATNSLSDVYAMGGRPFTAMNICCFPVGTVGLEVLAEILRGGAEQVAASGAILAGGHTVVDAEPKFGLSVTGFVQEEHLTTKDGARAGQLLVLSKPLGTGILTTAVKRGLTSEAEISEAFDGMRTLNDKACAAMNQAGVRTATDITGYGLLGHCWEMVRGQNLRFVLEASRLPAYSGALELARQGVFPGGSTANREWLEGLGAVTWHDEVDEAYRGLVTDAQTSGGLLMVWPEDVPVADGLWTIGRVEEKADQNDPGLLVLP
jgi:selenide,water dikinase